MTTTVWEIGDKVYGVHIEIENAVFTVYVTEEKIVEFFPTGGWRSVGKVNGVPVNSELFGDAYDNKEDALKRAEKIAKEAEKNIGNGWNKVVRAFPKREKNENS